MTSIDLLATSSHRGGQTSGIRSAAVKWVGSRLELELGHGALLAATYERYAAELAAINAGYRDGAGSPVRWTSATGCHCQDRPTCVCDTRLIDLIVVSVCGRRRPRAVMMGAAGIVVLL